MGEGLGVPGGVIPVASSTSIKISVIRASGSRRYRSRTRSLASSGTSASRRSTRNVPSSMTPPITAAHWRRLLRPARSRRSTASCAGSVRKTSCRTSGRCGGKSQAFLSPGWSSKRRLRPSWRSPTTSPSWRCRHDRPIFNHRTSAEYPYTTERNACRSAVLHGTTSSGQCAEGTLTRENGQPTDSNLAQPSSVILLRARTPICASVF